MRVSFFQDWRRQCLPSQEVGWGAGSLSLLPFSEDVLRGIWNLPLKGEDHPPETFANSKVKTVTVNLFGNSFINTIFNIHRYYLVFINTIKYS